MALIEGCTPDESGRCEVCFKVIADACPVKRRVEAFETTPAGGGWLDDGLAIRPFEGGGWQWAIGASGHEQGVSSTPIDAILRATRQEGQLELMADVLDHDGPNAEYREEFWRNAKLHDAAITAELLAVAADRRGEDDEPKS